MGSVKQFVGDKNNGKREGSDKKKGGKTGPKRTGGGKKQDEN